jgi:cbb3-type cytochrome oxidase maturation protein
MSVIYIVLPLALLAAATAVGGFIWASRSGQFDDLTTPGVRVALDDGESADRPGSATRRGQDMHAQGPSQAPNNASDRIG